MTVSAFNFWHWQVHRSEVYNSNIVMLADFQTATPTRNRAKKAYGLTEVIPNPSMGRKRDRSKVSTRPLAGLCARTYQVPWWASRLRGCSSWLENLPVKAETSAWQASRHSRKPTTCGQIPGSTSTRFSASTITSRDSAASVDGCTSHLV